MKNEQNIFEELGFCKKESSLLKFKSDLLIVLKKHSLTKPECTENFDLKVNLIKNEINKPIHIDVYFNTEKYEIIIDIELKTYSINVEFSSFDLSYKSTKAVIQLNDDDDLNMHAFFIFIYAQIYKWIGHVIAKQNKDIKFENKEDSIEEINYSERIMRLAELKARFDSLLKKIKDI